MPETLSLDVTRYARLWRWLWWLQRFGVVPAFVTTFAFLFFGFLYFAGRLDDFGARWVDDVARAPVSEEARRVQPTLLAACFRLLNDGFADGAWWLVALTAASGLIVVAFQLGCGVFRLRLATMALAALAVVTVIDVVGLVHAVSLIPYSSDERAPVPEFDRFYSGIYLVMTSLLFIVSFVLWLAQGMLIVLLWRHRLRHDLPPAHDLTRSLGINFGLLQFTWARLSAAGVATQLVALVVPLGLAVMFHRWIFFAVILGAIDILSLVTYLLIYPVVLIVDGGTAGGAPGWYRETILSSIDDPPKLIAIAAVLMAARIVWRFGTRLHRRRRDDVVLKDKPPVLLLRSFADDAAGIPPNALLPRLFFRRKRLEETIGAELSKAGPFVAIGMPGERLPQLGAQRLYVADAKWQEVVTAYIGRAERIMMIAGTTHWVRWELASTIAQDGLGKLLIVFPRISDADRAARWENLMGAFRGTPWERGAAGVDTAGALAVFMDSERRFVAIRSRRAHESDYQSVLRVATYLMSRAAIGLRQTASSTARAATTS